MKAKVSGIEVEGTAQEINELIALQKKKPEMQKPVITEFEAFDNYRPEKKVVEKPVKRAPRKWTPADDKLLIDNRKKPAEKIAVMLGGRFTPEACTTRLYGFAREGKFPKSDIASTAKTKKKRSAKWTPEEDAVLIANLKNGTGYRGAEAVLDRAYEQCKRRFYLLVEKGKASESDMPHGHYAKSQEKKRQKAASASAAPAPAPAPAMVEPKTAPKDEKENKSIERMRFIHSRAAVLCKQNGWAYEKAFFQASQEWNDRKGMGTSMSAADAAVKKQKQQEKKAAKPQVSLAELEFPHFNSIADFHQHFIEDMVRNMLGTSKKLTFRDMFAIVHAGGTTQWTGSIWLRFLAEFMAKSAQIARAFNVDNKFNIRKDGNGYDVLYYGM